MLSYIVRITTDFTLEHGYPPNTLVINKSHLKFFQRSFTDVDADNVLEELGLSILLVEENGHPTVSWFEKETPKVRHIVN